jgi:hypothetical protein
MAMVDAAYESGLLRSQRRHISCVKVEWLTQDVCATPLRERESPTLPTKPAHEAVGLAAPTSCTTEP